MRNCTTKRGGGASKCTAAVVASRGAALTTEQFDLDEPGFRDKVRAAGLAGFGQLSLHPHEARDTIRSGSGRRTCSRSRRTTPRSAAEIAALPAESLRALLDAADMAG